MAVRTGPHTSCGLVDRFYTGDYVTPHCYTVGDAVTRDGITYRTWSFVHLTALAEPYGWVSDAYLTKGGADRAC